MTQFSFGNIDEDTTDGFDLAAYLEAFEAAINSAHSGASAPAYKVAGTVWRDTTASPYLYKRWDGAAWNVIADEDPATHIYQLYHKGAVLTDIVTLGIGNGIESSGGNLRIKLDGATLTRGAGGLKITALGVTAAEIADATITRAKIAGDTGNKGKMIGYDLTSGDAVAMNAATGLVLLATVACTGTVVDFSNTISSDYNQCIFFLDNVTTNGYGPIICAQQEAVRNTFYDHYYCVNKSIKAGLTVNGTSPAERISRLENGGGLYLSEYYPGGAPYGGNGDLVPSGAGLSGYVEMYNLQSTTLNKQRWMQAQTTTYETGYGVTTYIAAGCAVNGGNAGASGDVGNQVIGAKFYSQGGYTFNSGSISLYGVKAT